MWGVSSNCRKIREALVIVLCNALKGNSQVEGDVFQKELKINQKSELQL